MIFPAPGRSARPRRTGVVGFAVVFFCGDPLIGVSDGIFDVRREVMMTWSAFPSLLLGRCRVVLPSLLFDLGLPSKAFAAPGEFSFRKAEGNLDRAGSRVGEPYLPLPPFEEGVDAIGELGSDLSTLNLCETGGRREAGGDQAGDFC